MARRQITEPASGQGTAVSYAFDPLIEKARCVRIENEIAHRGIALKRVTMHEYAGPCLVCGGRDRFSINTKKQIFRCRVCDKGGDVIAMVQLFDGSGFREAVRALAGDDPRQQIVFPKSQPKEQTPDEDQREKRRRAAWLWSQRQLIAGTVAEKYLRTARGIDCALPNTLGFLPARGDYPPAMIAVYSIPGESEPGVLDAPTGVDSVHITRLLPDGSDRERGEFARITLGQPLGRPIVLAPPNDLLGLAITEGIEEALTVHQVTGLGAWAAGSAPFMPSLASAVPNYIDCVTICADPDKAGQDNTCKLAEAIAARGINVQIEGLR
jgi:Toprim domain/CHC2 zinc finger